MSDVIPSRRTPVVTIGLILVNALAAAWAAGFDGTVLEPLPDGRGAFGWTAAAASVFVHFGWLSAIAGMLCLWIFGDNIEGAMGRGSFFAFYLATGMLGVAAHSAASPETGWPVAAGSAPVAAVLAAYFVMYPRSRVLMIVFLILHLDVVEIPAVFVAGIWVLIHLMAGTAAVGQGLTSGAAFGPPFAGGAAGALVGLTLRRRVRWE